MDPSSEPQLRVLLGLVVTAFVGIVVAIVLLVRSGCSVGFPTVRLRPRAATRSDRRDHVAIR